MAAAKEAVMHSPNLIRFSHGGVGSGLREKAMQKSVKIQPQRVPDLVMEQLMEWIMDGKLNMGQKLNTEELAQELGVSRMPVREAIKNMEKLGVAESTPYAGSRLVTLDKKDIEQIYMMRRALEPLLGYHACLNASDVEITETVRVQGEFENLMLNGSPTAKEIFVHNRAFHFAMYRGAHMDRIFHTVSMLWDNLAFAKLIFGQNYVESVDAAGHMMQEHRSFADALASREAWRLQELLGENLERTARRLPEKLSGYLEGEMSPRKSVRISLNKPLSAKDSL